MGYYCFVEILKQRGSREKSHEHKKRRAARRKAATAAHAENLHPAASGDFHFCLCCQYAAEWRFFTMKKTIKHMIVALTLLLAVAMLLSLAACGKEEAPAATQAPAAQTPAAPADTQAPTAEPEAQPSAQPETEEGVFVSASKGFRFEYDPKYIAVANPADNAMIYPTGDVEMPFCSVSLIPGSSAVEYLKEMGASAAEELGDSLKTAPAEPVDAGVENRQVYSISFRYESFEDGSMVACTYYAEDLPSGDIVVYNSTAPDGDTAVVDEILKTAIATFQVD